MHEIMFISGSHSPQSVFETSIEPGIDFRGLEDLLVTEVRMYFKARGEISLNVFALAPPDYYLLTRLRSSSGLTGKFLAV